MQTNGRFILGSKVVVGNILHTSLNAYANLLYVGNPGYFNRYLFLMYPKDTFFYVDDRGTPQTGCACHLCALNRSEVIAFVM